MNIQEIREKIKEVAERLGTKEVYTILLIIVVGFGSFGLGRLSKLQESKKPIRIEQTLIAGVGNKDSRPVSQKISSPNQEQNATEEKPLAMGGQIVASKTGSKYFFPWCAGSARISAANRISFNSVEEAKKAGYAPASNCKGLK